MKNTKTNESLLCSIKTYLGQMFKKVQKHFAEAQETHRKIKEIKESHVRRHPEIDMSRWF